MYSRLFVAVDGSEASLAAVREAVRLAAGSTAVIRVVAVAEIPAAVLTAEGANLPGVEHHALAGAREAVASAAAILSEAGIQFETGTSESLGVPVADVLVAAAAAWAADVIVVGTHGRTGWRRMVLGSVAESLARGAGRPVLLVHHHAESAPPGSPG
jgi:nucleotide-binding universal stress UspA family protein